MMAYSRKLELTEKLAYFAIWTLVFLIPVISVVQQANSDLIPSFRWSLVFYMWREFIPYFILFFVYDAILTRFLADRRTTKFLILVCISFAAFYAWIWGIKTKHHYHGRQLTMSEVSILGNEDAETDVIDESLFIQKRHEPNESSIEELMKRSPNAMAVAIAVVMLIINTAIKLYVKGINDEVVMRTLEREKLESELKYLRHQISPHFFMNTLNNIHSLMDVDVDKAQASLLSLSKMMRYVLYDSNNHWVSLAKELEFLTNYIMLMKLRYDETVLISTDFPNQVPEVNIPPMLVVNYVENAFKHGIRNKTSFVNVFLQVHEGWIVFHCINSMHPKPTMDHEHGSGIGLSNTDKRLKLLFGERYSCTIKTQNNIFDLLLKIPTQ